MYHVQESLHLENNIEDKLPLRKNTPNKGPHQLDSFLILPMASHKETHSQTSDFHLIVNTMHYSLVVVGDRVQVLAVMRDYFSMAEVCSRMSWILTVLLMSHLATIRFKDTLIKEVSTRKRLKSNTSRSSRRKATRRNSTSLSRYWNSQSNRKFTLVNIHRQNGRKKGRRQSRDGSRD